MTVNSYACLWMFVGGCTYSWICIAVDCCVWPWMAVEGKIVEHIYLCIPMDGCGWLWMSIDSYGLLCISMNSCVYL